MDHGKGMSSDSFYVGGECRQNCERLPAGLAMSSSSNTGATIPTALKDALYPPASAAMQVYITATIQVTNFMFYQWEWWYNMHYDWVEKENMFIKNNVLRYVLLLM